MIKSIAFAPLEGITTHTFRNVFKKHFRGVDQYFSPFLGINHTHKFMTRDRQEYLPFQEDLIPQVLTNKAED
ncbi:MAG: diguanylate cyclase, partial [Lachnospiraceae bacterium]|nr:diguanylate cyclase [Lachnospiraceae bacterium]